MGYAGKIVGCAIFISLGVLFPIFFHFMGGFGPIFLPMHIPVIIAGLLLGSNEGFIVGVLTPIVSSMITGMPPIMPILPIMVAELAVYGVCAGFLYNKRRLNLYFSLLTTMVVGRLAAMVTAWGLVNTFHIKIQPIYYISGAIVTGFPGILLQIVIIPLIVSKLKAAYSGKNKMVKINNES